MGLVKIGSVVERRRHAVPVPAAEPAVTLR